MVFKALFIHRDDDHNSLLKQNFSATLFLLLSFLSALEHLTMPVLTGQLFLNCAVPKLLELKIIFQKGGFLRAGGRQKR